MLFQTSFVFERLSTLWAEKVSLIWMRSQMNEKSTRTCEFLSTNLAHRVVAFCTVKHFLMDVVSRGRFEAFPTCIAKGYVRRSMFHPPVFYKIPHAGKSGVTLWAGENTFQWWTMERHRGSWQKKCAIHEVSADHDLLHVPHTYNKTGKYACTRVCIV